MVYHFSDKPRGERLALMSTEARTTFAPEAERVAAVLRDQIVEGRRAPGSRLVERDIAAELAVSRIPVRDALRVLVGEGLVTARPRTWAVVRTFSAADIDELIEVRSALETLAFRRAADRGSADQLAVLAAHLANEEQFAGAADAPSARRAGADFHETVVAMAGNRLLSELYASTRSRMRWLLGQHSDLVTMAVEHAALYRALCDRDADRAAALAHAHLETSRRAAHEHAVVGRDLE
jgi:DNA-binding GntR family transcriptional regulator